MSTIVGVNVFEAQPALGGAVAPAPNSITGVLGLFDRGVPNRIVRLTSPAEIEANFGPVRPDAQAALGLIHFFGNGGTQALAARIVGDGAVPAARTLDDMQAAPAPVLRLRGGRRGLDDPGPWGQRVLASVTRDPTFTGALANDAAVGDTSVRLASAAGLAAGQTLRFDIDPGGGVITQLRTIATVNAGTGDVTFATALGTALTAAGTSVETTEFRLQIFYRSAAALPSELVEDYRGLNLIAAHPRYAPAVINDPEGGSLYITAEDIRAAGQIDENAALAPSGPVALTGGSDPVAAAANYVGDTARGTGLHAFDTSQIQLLTLPDAHNLAPAARLTAVTAAMDYCAGRGDCMFIGALPDRGGATARPQSAEDYTQTEAAYVTQIEAFTASFRRTKSFAAFVGPHGAVADPTANGPASRRMIPLCLPVAGVYARIAGRDGVFRPAAGGGATLRGIVALSAHLSDQQNTTVVRSALANMVRQDDQLGLHLATSRTTSTDPRWFFTNIRLLFNFITASLRDGMRNFVHETHDARLRAKAVTAVSGFLDELRRRGAFATDDAATAFRIKSDTDNNTSASISRGELHVDVEINPVRPAEEITLRIGVTPQGVALTEN